MLPSRSTVCSHMSPVSESTTATYPSRSWTSAPLGIGTSTAAATVVTSTTVAVVGSTRITSLASCRTSNFPEDATRPPSSSSMRGLYRPIFISALDVSHTVPSLSSNCESGTPWLTSAKVANSTGGHSAATTLLAFARSGFLPERTLLTAHTLRLERQKRGGLRARLKPQRTPDRPGADPPTRADPWSSFAAEHRPIPPLPTDTDRPLGGRGSPT